MTNPVRCNGMGVYMKLVAYMGPSIPIRSMIFILKPYCLDSAIKFGDCRCYGGVYGRDFSKRAMGYGHIFPCERGRGQHENLWVTAEQSYVWVITEA